ncbi:type VI secretion system baseplate subunit TssK [Variovorax sp. J22R133]|uniref:type VI secretion system baseplate subunit TssK n=1 Tax=Variovorax brevis TaxID=3053503 RepID=UPI002576E572|nr:type VI secretion system baseplate subunit TssK [Variovorax sp. J22R133]MDM0117250.1 type VI secretion system baseplate subunit TssK [Variovorax sp. J22R133]
MSWRTKVVWSEGMLLQPQHLQQSERHAEYARHLLLRSTTPYAWGVAELEIDTAALALGKLALVRAVGVFGDGTPFDMPAVDPLPEAIDIPATMRDEAVVLALPLRRAGAREADAETFEDLVRHRVMEVDVPDSNTAGERSAMLQLGKLHTRLLRASDATDAWTTLKIARVVERRVDNQVQLDRHFVPPLLDVAGHALVKSWLDELIGLLRQRGNELVGSLTPGGTGGVAEIADFLMLQTINRQEAVFAHLQRSAMVHPQHFFEHALSLAGDLITFRDSRRTTKFGPYVHDDLALSFRPVMEDLRRSFSIVFERPAVRIELHDRKNKVHVAVIKNVELQRSAIFVLAANANMPSEALRARFPTQVTIGPVERIRELVTQALPGVVLTPLPVAPRQIPFHAGASYFELETRNSDLWRQLEQSGGVAMHVAGDFPGLELAFWAIRQG